jgi:hypothetical protein
MDDYPATQIGKPDLQQQSTFFTKLPVEIRLAIYEHLSAAPQHVEKACDSGLGGNRRVCLIRRPHRPYDEQTTSLRRQERWAEVWAETPPESWSSGLSFLLVCRRTYLEAATSIQPRSLVFTDLDTLIAYLTWPRLSHTRHRVQELVCSWHAEGMGAGATAGDDAYSSYIPSWKVRCWASCCDAFVTELPQIRRIRASIYSSTGRYHAQEETIVRLLRRADERNVRVDVDVINEGVGMPQYQHMTGTNYAMFLLFG